MYAHTGELVVKEFEGEIILGVASEHQLAVCGMFRCRMRSSAMGMTSSPGGSLTENLQCT